jgi:hypothetical protein
MLVLAGALACGPQVGIPSGGSTGEGPSTDGDVPPAGQASATGSSATGAPTTTGSADVTTDDGTSFGGPDDGDDDPPADEGWVDFIMPPDVTCAPPLPPGSKASVGLQCDLYAQDCPAGEKCSPAALCDATTWNGTICSPLDPDPAQAGDPCTVQDSPTSGHDDCDIGLMCAFVDPQTLEGTCVPHCTGSEANPICEADTEVCTFGTLTLCLPNCNPLVDDCELGTCVPAGGEFGCFWGSGTNAPGEPCDYVEDCVAGAVCVSGLADECGDGRIDCCASFCDLNAADPNAACLPGQTCTPWYRDGGATPPLDAVGVCGVEG